MHDARWRAGIVPRCCCLNSYLLQLANEGVECLCMGCRGDVVCSLYVCATLLLLSVCSLSPCLCCVLCVMSGAGWRLMRGSLHPAFGTRTERGSQWIARFVFWTAASKVSSIWIWLIGYSAGAGCYFAAGQWIAMNDVMRRLHSDPSSTWLVADRKARSGRQRYTSRRSTISHPPPFTRVRRKHTSHCVLKAVSVKEQQ